MAPRDIVGGADGPNEAVRTRLLSALHVGRLRPGQKVLSVRRLADMIGVNRKTVHRVYTDLAREGFLEVRPGSGTFVAERRSVNGSRPSTPSLLGILDTLRRDAERMGLPPAVLTRFAGIALGDGLRAQRVGVVECNGDQLAVIRRDLAAVVGEARPVLLDQLEADPAAALGGLTNVVTTDCHYGQVTGLLKPLGVQIYTVALDSTFPRYVLRLAAHDDVLLVAADRRFGATFMRLLDQLARQAGRLARIRVVELADAAEAFRAARPGTWVSCSPLVPSSVSGGVPTHLRPVEPSWRVDDDAVEAVRAGLAFELAIRQAG